MLGVQVGRVRPEHLRLGPVGSPGLGVSTGQAPGPAGRGTRRLPQALQVGSGARRGLRLRWGRRSWGSPEEGTKAAGWRHHLPHSALQQLGVDRGQRAPHEA